MQNAWVVGMEVVNSNYRRYVYVNTHKILGIRCDNQEYITEERVWRERDGERKREMERDRER